MHWKRLDIDSHSLHVIIFPARIVPMTEDKKPDLAKTYKLKGAQQISLSEYEAMRARDAKNSKSGFPGAQVHSSNAIFCHLHLRNLLYPLRPLSHCDIDVNPF